PAAGPPRPPNGPGGPPRPPGGWARALPPRSSVAVRANVSHGIPFRMLLLLCAATCSLERVGELRVGEELRVAERLEGGAQGGLLAVAEVERAAQPAVEVGVRLDVPAVMVDHLVEGLEAAVVHVRGGELDVAQRRRLEQAQPGAVEGDVADAAIGVLDVA